MLPIVLNNVSDVDDSEKEDGTFIYQIKSCKFDKIIKCYYEYLSSIFGINFNQIYLETPLKKMPIISEPITRIHSVNELFQFFGFEFEKQSNEEVSAKNPVSEQILRIPKEVFSEF